MDTSPELSGVHPVQVKVQGSLNDGLAFSVLLLAKGKLHHRELLNNTGTFCAQMHNAHHFYLRCSVCATSPALDSVLARTIHASDRPPDLTKKALLFWKKKPIDVRIVIHIFAGFAQSAGTGLGHVR